MEEDIILRTYSSEKIMYKVCINDCQDFNIYYKHIVKCIRLAPTLII